MLSDDDYDDDEGNKMEETLKGINLKYSEDVISSLAYLGDRIGVPRDMPLAAARYLRAYLNRAIHAVYSKV
jgi:glutathione S-transferase